MAHFFGDAAKVKKILSLSHLYTYIIHTIALYCVDENSEKWTHLFHVKSRKEEEDKRPGVCGFLTP